MIFYIILILFIIFIGSMLFGAMFEFITNKDRRCKRCGSLTKFAHNDMDGNWYKCPNCGNEEYYVDLK